MRHPRYCNDCGVMLRSHESDLCIRCDTWYKTMSQDTEGIEEALRDE